MSAAQHGFLFLSLHLLPFFQSCIFPSGDPDLLSQRTTRYVWPALAGLIVYPCQLAVRAHQFWTPACDVCQTLASSLFCHTTGVLQAMALNYSPLLTAKEINARWKSPSQCDLLRVGGEGAPAGTSPTQVPLPMSLLVHQGDEHFLRRK